jgi:antirestriction protein ArdC
MRNTYQEVTDRIVAMLESGVKPWQRSWKTGGDNPLVVTSPMARPLRVCGQPYTGMNVLNLWAASMVRGFSSRHWMTYKSAQALGAQVRKGSKSELAFYVGKVIKPAENEGEDDRLISFMRTYAVFNADQIDGLPDRFKVAAPVAPVAPVPAPDGRNPRVPHVDIFVDNVAPRLAHGGDKAFYMPSTDSIRMPHLEQFEDSEAYYATLLHETVHWTSHAQRCDRQLGKRFGDDAYAAEELVAELGAAFLCADLAISDSPRPDHASYLASWLKVLKSDNRAIFRAASLAEKAATFMRAAQPGTAEQPEEMELAA